VTAAALLSTIPLIDAEIALVLSPVRDHHRGRDSLLAARMRTGDTHAQGSHVWFVAVMLQGECMSK
jgi:hypothetical protein